MSPQRKLNAAYKVVKALAESDPVLEGPLAFWCKICGGSGALGDRLRHEEGCAFQMALDWMEEHFAAVQEGVIRFRAQMLKDAALRSLLLAMISSLKEEDRNTTVEIGAVHDSLLYLVGQAERIEDETEVQEPPEAGTRLIDPGDRSPGGRL